MAEKLHLSRALKGVIVMLENQWFTISVIVPTIGMNSFEASSAIISNKIRLKDNALSEVLKLGSWVILHNAGQNVYQIVRQCNEILPTYVYKDLVLLRTNICFQEKNQEGYGRWVWSSELGRIAAVCHERYKPKQDYAALVARKPAKYQFIVEYNWMLTKYIEVSSLSMQFDVIFQEYRICSRGENRFNIHYNKNGDNCANSAMDDEHLFFEKLEETKHKNCTSNNIYDVIRKVVSNPNIRITMKNYRPKELLSICESLNLKFND
ncbi:Uncharacterized protein BM_BM10835 [Brugia malayi]|uniref:Uncharacterized protein n=1 Tax=Brugia malayi TaxID=6279 RepID=A0A4E9F486_BRUMA|nr:Uncharacterized protein BM_BM10835 [Brugia malayi]VIO91613.1 Uncharacterized protein BM_BM10835 [Brugia malayi]